MDHSSGHPVVGQFLVLPPSPPVLLSLFQSGPVRLALAPSRPVRLGLSIDPSPPGWRELVPWPAVLLALVPSPPVRLALVPARSKTKEYLFKYHSKTPLFIVFIEPI